MACLALGLAACASVVESPNATKPDLVKASEANVSLGAAYLQQGLYGSANEKLEKALEQNPDSAEAHNIYAVLMGELGKPKEAQKHFEKSLDLDPESSDIRNNYGTFLCGQGKIDEAVEQFQQALLDPLYETPAYAFANAGACLMQVPDLVRAEEFLRKALQHNKRLGSALFQMAKLNYLKSNYAAAKAYLERYHRAAGKTPASLWMGIKVAWQVGDNETASSYGLLLKNQYPDSVETQKLLQAESTRK
ncbi:type IV pilus biogenesis/stability protein PilW [gamma proteobacterium HTCC5015]|nr:type IV pilus biogenesis/stability protein PilW [gamma proteobacterium HTCC5015]